MQRACIFVDGENFRHSICGLFPSFNPEDQLPKDADWSSFFDFLVAKATNGEGLRLRTYWYVVDELVFQPYKLFHPTTIIDGRENLNTQFNTFLRRYYIYQDQFDLSAHDEEKAIEETKKAHDKLATRIGVIKKRFEGWKVLYDGISSKHTKVEFRKAGSIKFDLMKDKFIEEKGVDVALAIDMLRLKDNYDIALIVSGDQDYVPAVKAVKDKGITVANISFEKADGKLLPGGARRLNVETDFSLNIRHEEFKNFLNL